MHDSCLQRLKLWRRRTVTWHVNVMVILIRCFVCVLDLLPFIACTSCQLLDGSSRTIPGVYESKRCIPGVASEAILEPRLRSRKCYVPRESSDH